MIQQVSSKFYDQLINGNDFSENTSVYSTRLRSSVQSRVRGVFEVDVWAVFAANDSNLLYFNGSELIRGYGSWISDQFCVGDTIEVVNSGTPSNDGARTITAITDTVITLNSPFGLINASSAAIVYLNTELTEMEWKFGLIENTTESLNFLSKIDGSEQKFSASEVGVSGATTVVAGTASGSTSSWKHGSITFQYLSTTDYKRRYKITHDFIVLPYYREGELSNIQDVVNPDLFDGSKSLKYVYDFRTLRLQGDNTTSHGGTYNQYLGVISYFNETLNSGATIYSIDNVELLDVDSNNAVESLQTRKKTRVRFEINSLNTSDVDYDFTTNTRFCVNHSFLPFESEYREGVARSRTFENNFMFETLTQKPSAAAVNGTIITDLTAVLNSTTKITVTCYVEYSADQISRLDDTKDYLLSCTITNETASANSSPIVNVMTNLIVDTNKYINDTTNPNLFGVEDFTLLQHTEEDGVDDGHTSVGVFVEDKLLSTFRFWLDTDESAFIKQLAIKLVAFNQTTGDSFELQSTTINTNSFVVSSGIQQIYVDNSRGFLLNSASQFNEVFVDPDEMVGTKQYYNVKWAFALNWEDYRALIEANAAFFDNAELNNGLNYLSSNYSDKEGYQIRLFIEALTTDGEYDTSFREISPILKVHNYDETTEASTAWAVTKQFFGEDDSDVGTSVLTDQKTRVLFTFTKSSSTIGTLDWGAVRLEEYQNGGLVKIHELSTEENSARNNPLIPLDTETHALLTEVSSAVATLECRIDNRYIEKGKKYHISGRIAETPIPVVVGKEFEDDDIFEFEDGAVYEFE